MGIEETVGDDAESSRLPRLDSAERDSSSVQEQSLNTVEERKIQNQSRPAAVVGISARYGSSSSNSFTRFDWTHHAKFHGAETIQSFSWHIEDFRLFIPYSILCREGEGMEKLLEVIRDTLQKEQKQARKLKTEQQRSKTMKHGKAPQWQL